MRRHIANQPTTTHCDLEIELNRLAIGLIFRLINGRYSSFGHISTIEIPHNWKPTPTEPQRSEWVPELLERECSIANYCDPHCPNENWIRTAQMVIILPFSSSLGHCRTVYFVYHRHHPHQLYGTSSERRRVMGQRTQNQSHWTITFESISRQKPGH